ncbi:putative periplasmic serine protease do/hhoA-like protein (fragment) [Capnocytophaga canimorsus]|uniref:Putative periplasmic serine protease do/hhoA-like protein n=1 Tax=Capnocytophaga canimorsus TaxID=28188 RepID=A0A0B7ISP6_9FLAO
MQTPQVLEVTLNNNKSYPAKLIGTDVSSDIALLKIDTEEQLPFLTFADSDNTQIGEWVLAVGNPFNLNSTVTAGIISAKARNISQNISDKVESFIQTDAAVNQGNSGGALVNLKGDLIGINTAITSTTGSYVGYSFAVPSNIAKKVVEDLIEYGNVQKGVLGVRGTELNSESAEKLGIKQTEGFYVDSVEDDSGAANAGIQKGDVIKQIDNVRIHKFSDLTGYIASKRPGDVLKVLFERNAKEKTVNITLQKNATYIINSLGLEVKNLSDKDKSTFKTKNGVKITGASQFYEFHNVKMTGKVLLSVNGNTFKDVDELKNILSQLSSNQRNSLELLNEKGEKERFFF